MEQVNLLINLSVTGKNIGWSVATCAAAVVLFLIFFGKDILKNHQYTSPEFFQRELFEQMTNFLTLIDEKLIIKYIEVVDYNPNKGAKFTAYVYFCPEGAKDLRRADIVHTEGLKKLHKDAKSLLKSKMFSFDAKGNFIFHDENILNRVKTQLKVHFLKSGSSLTLVSKGYLWIPEKKLKT